MSWARLKKEDQLCARPQRGGAFLPDIPAKATTTCRGRCRLGEPKSAPQRCPLSHPSGKIWKVTNLVKQAGDHEGNETDGEH